MKRMLLITITLVLMFVPACKKKSVAGIPIKMRGYANVLPNEITITFEVKIDANQNVVVNESCSNCTTVIPALKCPGILNWDVKIDNSSIATVRVDIQNFQTVSIKYPSGMVYSRPPDDLFGAGMPQAFSFTASSTKTCKPIQVGVFKYSVIVTLTQGSSTKITTLDPRVVFDY